MGNSGIAQEATSILFSKRFGVPLMSPGDFPFERLSSERGLSQNMITCLMQDRKGFLWVGTKDGLNRFDGYRFKVYRHDPFDSTSISNNHINHIVQDREGRIWVSTYKGLNLFDPERETCQRIFPDSIRGYDLSSERILSVFVDSRNRLWLNTDDDNIHLLEIPPTSRDIRDLKIRRIRYMPDETGSLVRILAIKLFQDKDGMFWVYAPNGLFRFKENTAGQGFTLSKKFPEVNDPSWRNLLETLDDNQNRFFRIGPGQDGSIWIGSADKIGCWSGSASGWRVFPLTANPTYDINYLWNETFEILEDREGAVWISMISGLLQIKPDTRAITYYASGTDADNPLHHGAAPLLEDQGGILWIGTKGHGLLKLDRKAKRFAGKMHTRPSRFLYKGESLRAICKSSDGQIWISPSGKSLHRFHPESNEIRPVQIAGNILQNESVFTILEDAHGMLWLGSSSGLIKISKRDANPVQFEGSYLPEPENNKPKYNYIWQIITGNDGALWMITSTNLCRFDPATKTFRSFPYLPEKNLTILNNEFPSLFQDINGILWIGTSEGLLRFDPTDHQFRHFKNDPKDPTSLSQNTVKSIAADPAEPGRYLWVGTGGGGLNRFDQKTATFENFTEKDGLPDMVVYAILSDSSGNLWMSTNKGLSVFQPKTRRFRNFDERDGLQNLEFNSASYFKSKDGQLFFGGIQGFNAFYPKNMLAINTHRPPVVFIDFKLSNKSVTLKSENSPLRKAIPWSEEIVLGFEEKTLSFEFAALDFTDPSKNQFAYKMEGFDEDWQYAGNSNSTTYTNLQPGTYTFRVKGSNNDGLWNEQGASVRIVILPPWWRTWWAYIGYALTLGGLFYFFRKKELQEQRLQHSLELEQAEALRLKELNEAKSIFLSTVSHELRTPLTSIMGFSKIVKKRLHDRILPFTDLSDPKRAKAAEQVNDNLEIVILESERLTNLINQVLDLAKIEAGKVEWQQEPIEIGDVIERAIAATATLFDDKKLRLVKAVEEQLPTVIGDKDRLIQVIVNLLSNAIKFTDKGSVRCSANFWHNQIEVCIEDTGIGIAEKDLDHVFEKFKQVGDDSLTDKPKGTGLGLPICREIVEHHGGRIWAESTLGKGSRFIFSLPVQNDMEKP